MMMLCYKYCRTIWNPRLHKNGLASGCGLSQGRRGLYDSIVAFANLLDETEGTHCSAWLRVLLLDAVLDIGQRRSMATPGIHVVPVLQ
jgi:hypothetical protein